MRPEMCNRQSWRAHSARAWLIETLARTLERTTRQVQLTRHGADLLEATSRHLDALDEAMARVGRSARGKRQTVSLGTTPLVAANVLPQAMREYRRHRPELRVRCSMPTKTRSCGRSRVASSTSAWACSRASQA
jgi:hypothetical protein